MQSTDIPDNSFVPEDNEDTKNSKQNNLKSDIEDDNTNILPIESIKSEENSFNQTLQELPEEESRIDVRDVLEDEVECNESEKPFDVIIPLESEKLNEEKVVFNAVELMAKGSVELNYLMGPIFPQKGTALLAAIDN